MCHSRKVNEWMLWSFHRVRQRRLRRMKRGGDLLSNRSSGTRTTRTRPTIIIDSMKYRFGDIVLLDYPFTNAVGSKRRPGLILLPEDDGDILFARITSQDREGI